MKTKPEIYILPSYCKQPEVCGNSLSKKCVCPKPLGQEATLTEEQIKLLRSVESGPLMGYGQREMFHEIIKDVEGLTWEQQVKIMEGVIRVYNQSTAGK